MKYRVLVYRKHVSGIGMHLIKEKEVTKLPSLKSGYFRDITNNCWARWIDLSHDKE